MCLTREDGGVRSEKICANDKTRHGKKSAEDRKIE